MKNKILLLIAISVMAVVPIAAAVTMKPAVVEPTGMTISVSDESIDNSPALEELNERGTLTKITYIHYKDGSVKTLGAKPEKSTTCYAFLSKGAKLKGTKSLTIHPTLNTTTILNSAGEWDSHTSAALFDGYTIDSTANWDSDAPDGRNEFSYGNYPQSGVIAVTNVWGYFYGPLPTREIVEFDIMFDTDFVWGDATVSAGVMDLQNIATHEIGHGVGLADLYNTVCYLETMYGYSGYGETNKRTLGSGDITGLQKLYGA